MPSTVISINHLPDIEWKTTPMETAHFRNCVAVWRINVADFTPYLNTFHSLLSSLETVKSGRYQQENDQQRYIIGKAVLRILLSRYLNVDAKTISFREGKNKKPELENGFNEKLHFNISHSGDYILIAIADAPVGIDVEQMHASFTYQNLLPFSFSEEETAFIENATHSYQSFYQLWTRKESLLKATGKGLVDEMALIPSLTGIHPNLEKITGSNKNWQITSFAVDENHIGSVAFMPVKTALQFFSFRL